MKIRNILLAFFVCILFGCGTVLILRTYDHFMDDPAPITGGQLLSSPSLGISLRFPEAWELNDNTPEAMEDNNDILYAVSATGPNGRALYLYVYLNEQGDHIDAYSDQELVSYYMHSGCDDVRMRTLSDRRFICYRAAVETENGNEYWHAYETWDPSVHIVFETQMLSSGTLPILRTLTLSDSVLL